MLEILMLETPILINLSGTSPRITPSIYIWDTNYSITPATTGDKALAGILTTLFSVSGFGFAAWLAI